MNTKDIRQGRERTDTETLVEELRRIASHIVYYEARTLREAAARPEELEEQKRADPIMERIRSGKGLPPISSGEHRHSGLIEED